MSSYPLVIPLSFVKTFDINDNYILNKGILTLAYAGQARTQGMAMSHKWVSYVQRCLSTLTNSHNPNQIQMRSTIFRYNFLKTIAFGPCIYYTDFYYWGFMHSCMFKNTTFHECFFHKIFISIYFKANFIRLALHSCMFKNTYFHEWNFSQDIHFISIYIVLMEVLFVLGLTNTT